MLSIYWGLLLVGLTVALISVIFGDVLGSAFDGVFDYLNTHNLHALEPMVVFGGMATLGGSGILLTNYTPLSAPWVLALSLLIAVAASTVVYFAYVRPMRRTENSLAFSERDLAGKIAEVSIAIPAVGYGEVLLAIAGSRTNQIAASFDQKPIEAGARVVVVDVEDRTLLVSRLDTD